MHSKKLLTIVKSDVHQLDINQIVKWDGPDYSLEKRKSGEFKNLALYLSDKYEWVIGRDSYGHTILVALDPTKSAEIGGASVIKASEAYEDIQKVYYGPVRPVEGS